MKKFLVGGLLLGVTSLFGADVADFWKATNDSYAVKCTDGYYTTITSGNSGTWCTTNSGGKSSCNFYAPQEAAQWACR